MTIYSRDPGQFSVEKMRAFHVLTFGLRMSVCIFQIQNLSCLSRLLSLLLFRFILVFCFLTFFLDLFWRKRLIWLPKWYNKERKKVTRKRKNPKTGFQVSHVTMKQILQVFFLDSFSMGMQEEREKDRTGMTALTWSWWWARLHRSLGLFQKRLVSEWMMVFSSVVFRIHVLNPCPFKAKIPNHFPTIIPINCFKNKQSLEIKRHPGSWSPPPQSLHNLLSFLLTRIIISFPIIIIRLITITVSVCVLLFLPQHTLLLY